MKSLLTPKFKNVILVGLCLSYYIVLFVLCRSFDIDFDYDGNDIDANIKIAIFYFIILPIAAALPVILYEFIKFIHSKIK